MGNEILDVISPGITREDKNTDWNHDVTCPEGSAIQLVKYKAEGNPKKNITHMGCIKLSNTGTPIAQTPISTFTNASIGFREFIKNQQLSCPEGHALSKMKISKDGNNVVSDYSCMPLQMGPNPHTFTKSGPWVETGGVLSTSPGHWVYQEHSGFNCPLGYVLNEVKYELSDGTQSQTDIGGN